MACQVFKDDQGNIQAVLDNEGQPSKLFQDALQLTNPQQALDIWSTAYSEDYTNSNGEFKKEPALENVLVFMNRNINQDNALRAEDIEGLRNNTLSLPISSLEEFNISLQALYPQGIFTVNENTLNLSGMYTQAESQTILNSEQIQNNIKNVADRLRSQVSLNNSVADINSQLASYETPELISVFNTENIVGIGKHEQLNPFLIDASLREKVGGIKNRGEFDLNMGDVNEAIYSKYSDDPEYAQRLFDVYSSMDRMAQMQDSEEGLSYITSSNIRNFTAQALIVGQDAQQLIKTANFLRGVPKDVWDNSGIEIEDMILRLEDYATDLGIDIVGLSEAGYSFEEIIPFLDSLQNLAVKAQSGDVNSEDLDLFYNSHDTVFKNNEYPVLTAQQVTAKNTGRKLVKLSSVKSEQTLFDENSLIRTQDTGIYHRVNKMDDIEGLYDYVTDLVQFNPNIINKTTLYPSAYNSNGEFSYKKATDINNRDAIRGDLQRYVQQQTLSEQLILYKLAFGHPLTFHANAIAVTDTTTVKSYEYLTGEFISDFAQQYLQEKSVDSEFFNKVLDHFSFNESGIILKDNDPYSRQEIQNLLPENSVLKQYLKISKDEALNSLFPAERYDITPIEKQREFYMNNPDQLSENTLQYESNDDGNYIAVQNTNLNFIRVGDNIWEKVKSYKNLSVYERLPNVSNPYYNQPIEFTPNTNVDVKQFTPLVNSLGTMTKIEKLYSKKQLETINNNKEC